jgi:hypothetical protein
MSNAINIRSAGNPVVLRVIRNNISNWIIELERFLKQYHVNDLFRLGRGRGGGRGSYM